MNTISPRASPDSTISVTLKKILKFTKKSGNSLARELGFPPPTINRLVLGEVKDPRSSTIIAIADYFKISLDQLLGRVNFPEKFTSSGESTNLIKPGMSIPVLSTTDVVEYKNRSLNPSNWFHWQAKSDISSQKSVFSVQIKNDLYQPIFPINTLIIINPELNPESNDFVLVVFSGDTIGVIKKYVSEGRYKYLYSLNQELKTIPFEPNDCTILGVVIEASIIFK